jgi:hypothetical protein
LEALDGLVYHVADASAFFVCHCCCGSCLGVSVTTAKRDGGGANVYFVEKDGTIYNEEIVRGWHVSECLRINEVVECRKERFRSI